MPTTTQISNFAWDVGQQPAIDQSGAEVDLTILVIIDPVSKQRWEIIFDAESADGAGKSLVAGKKATSDLLVAPAGSVPTGAQPRPGQHGVPRR